MKSKLQMALIGSALVLLFIAGSSVTELPADAGVAEWLTLGYFVVAGLVAAVAAVFLPNRG